MEILIWELPAETWLEMDVIAFVKMKKALNVDQCLEVRERKKSQTWSGCREGGETRKAWQPVQAPGESLMGMKAAVITPESKPVFKSRQKHQEGAVFYLDEASGI